MNDPASTDRIEVASAGDQALVRVLGRGSFKVSAPLKQFAYAMIDQGARRLVLDMKDCAGMDSTFMGMLAGLSFHLAKYDDGKGLVLVGLSPRTQGLLATLGLDRAVTTYPAGSAPAEMEALFENPAGLAALPDDDSGRKQTAEMMLEAHENLVELTAENLPRFKDVLTFLREDVEKDDPSASQP